MIDKKNKTIVFVTGTRADFGKQKLVIRQLEKNEKFDVHVFVTGMHMLATYGHTYLEVERENFENTHKYINQNSSDTMDQILAKTIIGFSDFVREMQPSLIMVHGDRVEAMAAAIVGQLNNVLVGHFEGGEVSGTVDEMIRHSISKLAHLHFVSNGQAKNRMKQLGEAEDKIFAIGSPDVDSIFSNELPSLSEAKKYYGIEFEDYAIAILHPVTTDILNLQSNVDAFFEALEQSLLNYVVIYPNNDEGTKIILDRISEFRGNDRFRLIPSMRFEFYLRLLQKAKFIIGNSSSGVREAPYYATPTINVGSRQNNRTDAKTVSHTNFSSIEILDAIDVCLNGTWRPERNFGEPGCAQRFEEVLLSPECWNTPLQKSFNDLY